jgi:hypothetical protein
MIEVSHWAALTLQRQPLTSKDEQSRLIQDNSGLFDQSPTVFDIFATFVQCFSQLVTNACRMKDCFMKYDIGFVF